MEYNLIQKFKWEFLTISSLALWWLSPIITKYTYGYIDFRLSLAFSSFFAFLYFLVLFIKNKDYIYFKQREWWKDSLIALTLNGIVFYYILFYWLQFTSSTNASIFWLMEIFFSFLLFGVLLWKWRIKKYETIWAILMGLWALIVLFPWTLKFNYWDIFIIIACFFAPIGNFYAKKAIIHFPSRFLMLVRSLAASIFLFLYVYLIGQFNLVYSDFMHVLPYLIFSGVVLFWFSKILWIDAYKYIWVPRASIFLTLYPIFTILYNIIFFFRFPTFFQVFWLLPLIIGIYFIFLKE